MHPGPIQLPRRRWWRRFVVTALVLISAIGLCIVLVWFSPVFRVHTIGALLWTEARLQPQRIPALQRALDSWLPPRSILLVGDSLAGMLPAGWVDSRAVNLGIGGAITEQVRTQLRDLHSLETARALVIIVGSNDLVHRSIPAAEADLRALLVALPANLPVLLCTVPPVNPTRQELNRPATAITRINDRWAACAADRPHTHLVQTERVLAAPSGALLTELDKGDGLHLNSEGNRRLAALLQQNLGKYAP